MQTATITELAVANNAIWALTVTCTKLSILMQYLRIFSSRTTRSLCYTLLFCLLPFACWAVFGGTLLCTPVRKLWEPQIPGHCMSAEKYWLSVAGTNTGLDFTVLLLPIPAISALRLPRKQKMSLFLVFTLGFCVCVTSLARLATVLTTSDEGHYVVSGIWAIIWSTVEANVGIICASLLALKPLVAIVFPRIMKDTEIPKHCLRLSTVETGTAERTWSGETTLVSPITPTTTGSKSESTFRRQSTATAPAPPVHVLTASYQLHSAACALQTPSPARRYDRHPEEIVGWMAMLQEVRLGVF